MSEHQHYGPLTIGANRDGMALYRIHDGGGKNPFDIGGSCICGRAVALEVKVIDAMPGYIPWHKFESQQVIWLKEFCIKGALSLAGIYYVPLQSMRIIQFTKESDFDKHAWPLKYTVLKKENSVYTGMRKVCSCSLPL